MTSGQALRRWGGCLILASGLVSCDRGPDPGLLEKTALLEAELRSRDERIDAMEDEAKQVSESAAGTLPIHIENARSGFQEKARSVRSDLEEKLGGRKISGMSGFPEDGADSSHPIVSILTFSLSGPSGGEISVPITADAEGNWQDPDLQAVIQKFKESSAAAPRQPAQPQAQRPPVEPQRSEPRDVMGAGQTHKVEWGDPAKPAPQAPPPSGQSQAPAPAPRAPQAPQKPVPTDRDVIIDFGD